MSDNITLPDGRPVESLKVAELKKELEVLGLDKNGLKKDLVKRLSEALSDSSRNDSIVDEETEEIPSDDGEVGEKIDEKSTAQEQGTSELACSLEASAVISPEVREKTSSDVQTSKITQDPLQHSERLDSSGIIDASPHIAISDHNAEASSITPVRANVNIDKPCDVAVPQSHQTVVEIHEEEEDYGDEEDMSIDAHIQEKSEKTPNKSIPREVNVNADHSNKKRDVEPDLNTQAKKETRVIGVTVEDPVRVNPSNIAKCPVSNLVYIRYLVRPFTQVGLKTMLEKHFGTSTELWLDRIKSSAMARFVDQATATKCREGLDGCRWPSINPRILQCEFGSEALFSWLKEQGEAGDKQPPRHLIDPSSITDANGNAPGNKWNRTNRGSTGSLKGKRHLPLGDDAGGSAEQSSKKMREENSKGSKRSDDTLKNLDDLFKKTEATPMIYWLPLSDEAAATQYKTRREKHIAEKTRRPVSKRNAEERRRDNRSPFMGEFDGGNPPHLPAADMVSKEKRARETTPSPDGNRSRHPHERRRSPPPPRRPRYTNRTPSPRMVGSRRPASPSPGSRYRRRSPPRR